MPFDTIIKLVMLLIGAGTFVYIAMIPQAKLPPIAKTAQNTGMLGLLQCSQLGRPMVHPVDYLPMIGFVLMFLSAISHALRTPEPHPETKAV